RVEFLDRPLLQVRILGVARGVGRLLVAEDERVAGVEALARELDSPAEVGDGIVALGRVDRIEAESGAESAEEGRLGDEAPADAVPLEEARVVAPPAPPFERDDIEALALEAAHDLPRPRLGRARRALGLVDEDVLRAHLLAAAERLEDGAPRELGRRVAEHRPVRDLARGRAARADRVEDAARAVRAQAVEVRRLRGLVARAAAEDVVRT